MPAQVSSDVVERLLAEAGSAHPRECCGILLGQGERIEAAVPADNVHPAPETHFEIDPAALIAAHRRAREGGPQVAGYYHSHPGGAAVPSATDRAMAAGDGAVWAIVAAPSLRLWLSAASGFEALPYRILAR